MQDCNQVLPLVRVGGLLGINSYYKNERVPYGQPEKYVKLFTVTAQQGNTAVAVIPAGAYSNSPSAVAVVKIHPTASLQSEVIRCNYLIDSQSPQGKISYYKETDGSITIYTKSYAYTYTGYSFVYKNYITIHNQIVDSLPSGAVQV